MRSKEVEVEINGIPAQDYNGFTSRTFYCDKKTLGISADNTIMEKGIFFNGVKITSVEEWEKAIEEFRKREKEYIPKQVIRDKIKDIEKQIKGEKANKYTIPECFLILHTLENLLGE